MSITEVSGGSSSTFYEEGLITSVLNSIDFGLNVIDQNGIFLKVNDSYCALTGYSAEELVGNHFKMLIPHDSMDIILAEYWDVLNRNGEVTGDWQLKKKNQSIIDIHIHSRHVVHNQRRIVVSTVRDISAHKREHRFLNNTQSAAMVGAWEYDLHNKALTLSDEVYNIFSLSRNSVIDIRVMFRFFSPKERKVFRKAVEEAISQGIDFDMELPLTDKKGNQKWVRATGKLTRQYNKPDKIVGTLKDITARKTAQDEVVKLSLVASKTSNGVLITDGKGRIEWANSSFFTMTGLNGAGVLNKKYVDVLKTLGVNNTIVNTVAQGLSRHIAFSVEIESTRQTGSERWIKVDVTPVLNEHSEADHFVMVGTDTTSVHEYEKEIQFQKSNLDALIDNAPGLIWSVDKQLRLVSANKAFNDEIYRRYGRYMAIGDCVLFGPEEETRMRMWRQLYDRALGGERFRIEIDFNLEVLTISEISFNPIVDAKGEITGVGCFTRDVTEERQRALELSRSHELIRMSEERFRSLVQNSTDVIMINDAKGNRQYISPSVEKVFGYKPHELLHQSIYNIIHPEAHDAARRLLQQCVQHKEVVQGQFRYKHKNGSWRIVEVSGSNQLDNPAINGIVANIRDVTERVEAEQQLKESELLFRTIAENFPNGYVGILDKDFNFLFADGTLFKHMELPVAEVIGKNYLSFYEGEMLKTAKTNLKKVLKKKEVTFEISFAGNHFFVAVVPLYDNKGEVDRLLLVSQVVTEQKRMQLALSASEERFRQLSASSPIGIFLTDEKAKVLWVNNRFEHITGCSFNDAIGDGWLNHVLPADREPMKKVVKQLVASGSPLENTEYRYISNGQVRWVLAMCAPMHNDEGVIIGFVGTLQDITNTKQLEAERERHQLELEHMVKERTAQLLESNMELEAFSYTVSHDLRTPIRAIQIFRQLLEKELGSTLTPGTLEYLKNIQTCSEEMMALINDLLEFSKVGRGELNRTIVDTNGLVRSLADTLLSVEGYKDVDLIIHPLPVVFADYMLLKSVWQNLLSNAIKYSGKREFPKIEVNCKKQGKLLIFSVKDNGVGFDMKYYDKLFKPFSRLHSSSEYKGTGAGLAIIDRIIKRHGGEIWAESQLGVGTIFYFSLPITGLEDDTDQNSISG